MGFLSGLGRFIQGKPVFEVPTDDQHSNQASDGIQPDSSSGFTDASGRKIIPRLTIRNVRTRVDGTQQTVYGWIQNESDFELKIEWINLLGQRHHIDRHVASHQGFDEELFRGAVPTSNAQNKAQIEYKIAANGDYFVAKYFVKFGYEADSKLYLVDEIDFEEGMTQDI